MTTTITYGPLVTVSATYGSGGSVIAPRLAEALQLPFVDRFISSDLSKDPAPPERSEEGLCEGEQTATPAGRFLSYFARAATISAVITPDVIDDDETLRQRAEAGLRDIAGGAPAVVLGRAAAVVLASRPHAYHVRLDGPVERRVVWAARHDNVGLDTARRRQAETDRARTLFVKRLFRVDPSDARLYHLLLDPTVIGVDVTVRLLRDAAQAFFAATAE